MRSPAFSRFRSLMDTWDSYLESEAETAKLNSMINQRQFSFFFEKEGSVYGAPEESRVVFAKMKHPDETVNAQWIKDANFSAIKLDNLTGGEESERVFGIKDIKGMKVVDQDQAMTTLSEKGKKGDDD